MKYNLDLVIEKLKEDKSIKKICQELNYPYKYINKLLRKKGIDNKDRKYSRIIDKEKAICLYEEYAQGIPIYKLAEKYSFDEMTISKAFHKFGMKILNLKGFDKALNHNFFKEINTEEKAYLLGFFAADGTIGKNTNCMALLIQSRDVEILDYYKKAFNYQGKYYLYPAKTKTHQDRLKICINSPINKDNLISLGFPPNKTYEMFTTPDKIMDESLYRHFIRGYFDGDGSIILKTKNSRVTKFKITSTNIEFLEFCKKELEKLGCYNIKIESRPNNLAKTLYIQNKNSIKLVTEYFYNSCNFSLQRKRIKMESVAQL